MTGRAGFGIARVREAVRRRAEDTSLRDVANDVGMSFSGLRSFIRGGAPHPATRRKLLAWYRDLRSQASRSAPREDFEAAVALIVRYVEAVEEPSRRRARLKALLRTLLHELDETSRGELAPALAAMARHDD
jgi:hypothetical protein